MKIVRALFAGSAIFPFWFLFLQLLSKGVTGEYVFEVGDGPSLFCAGVIWTGVNIYIVTALSGKPKGSDHDDQPFVIPVGIRSDVDHAPPPSIGERNAP